MRVLACLLLLGCRFAPSSAVGDAVPGGDDASTDATDDGPIDAPHDGPLTSATCLSKWYASTIDFDMPVRLTTVSTTSMERDPYLASDEHTIYFSSDRAGSMGGADIYTATRTALTDSFGAATAYAPANSTDGYEGKMAMTFDGLELVVSSSRGGGQGGADVWLATRTAVNLAFSAMSETLLGSVDDATAQYDSVLSDDGLRLYLAPSPSISSQDIALATRASRTASFSAPTLIAELVSGGNADPTLSPDERVLVFSSHSIAGSAGGVDIYYATRATSSGTFGTPIHLSTAINGSGNDADPFLSRDGCRLYFSSDILGTYDLYVATAK